MCVYKKVEYSLALAKLQNHTQSKSYNSASSSAGPSDHHSSMEAEAACNSASVLGIGYGKFSIETSYERPRKRPVKFHILFPIHSEKIGEEQDLDGSSSRNTDEEEDFNRSINNEDRNVTRKKLRLSKEQSSLLESSFQEHSTLTSIQKQELASQLNLRLRQVEVWFQNRRARTKLKQTEVDCEYLKKCCESLSEENRRLKKELLELKSIKLGSPFLIHLPRGPTNISMCPSCQKVSPVGGKNSNKTFYGAVKDASMAC